MDQIKSRVDVLAELNEEELGQLQADIVAEFEKVESEDPTAETVDAMTSLADMLDTVKGESQRREAAAEELAARAAEATMRVKGEDEETAGEEMEPIEEVTPVEEAPIETPVEDEAKAEDEMSAVTELMNETEDESKDSDEVVSEDSEAEETPEEEDSEEKKKDAKSFSADEESTDASATAVEGSELSTETDATEETVEEVAADAVVADAGSDVEEVTTTEVDAPVEIETEVAVETVEADVAPAVDVVAEVTEVVETSTEAVEFAAEESTETEPALDEQKEQTTVTAAADQPFEAPADRQPVLEVSEPAKVAITAGADIPGYTAGSEIKDLNEVATAMEKRLHSLRRVNGGDGEQHIVASFSTSYDEARTLTTDTESNMLKIAAVAGPEAITASGGHAAPFEVKYDIYGIGSTTDRPVRDALPRFQADRGGIRFVTPPSFASGDYANAVGVWTAANDSAETPSPAAKTSLTVAAAGENTVATDAVTLQLQFGNLMTRAYPELIARHNELALVQHAREAEQNLLTKIGDASTAVTTTNLIGFGRDFLVQVRRAAVAYRSRHRIDPQTQLKAIIPSWVYDAMAADLTLAMPGDNTLSVSQAEINGYLANSNVTLVASPDATVFGAQGASALLEFPDTFVWYLFAEGTFLFLDGGTLDLGIIRDSSLVGTNDYKMFIETFENVAKVGIESLKITSTISINGVAAALRDTTGGATAAAIEL